MEALVNSVVLTGGRGDKVMELGRGYNPQSVARYGLLQAVERLSGDEDPAQARQRIRTLLDQRDRLTQERTVEEPVSYTHLDVYKRQAPARPTLCAGSAPMRPT